MRQRGLMNRNAINMESEDTLKDALTLLNGDAFLEIFKDKTDKVTCHKNEMERKGCLQQTKIPYYRDELREKDRLKRLHNNGEKKMSADSKKQHSKNVKSEKYTTSNVRNTLKNKRTNATHSISSNSEINVLPLYKVVYVPVPLMMPNPFMRFFNTPTAMPSMMSPVHFPQTPPYFYNVVPGPKPPNYYNVVNKFRRFS